MSVCDLSFGPTCGDGMVLQRGQSVLWGWAEPGARFTLEVQSKPVSVAVGADGAWKASWFDLETGGPLPLFLDGVVLWSQVWVGDVWLAAGQSNMERSLEAGAEWPSDALSWRTTSAIRQITVPGRFRYERPDLRYDGLTWMGADTDQVRLFSASAFHMARNLWAQTGIPQGLVLTAVGGSAIQAWLSLDDLQADPDLRAEAVQFAQPGWLEALQASEAEVREAWWSTLGSRDPADPARAGQGEWRRVSLPQWNRDTEFGDLVGTLWLKKTVVLDDAELLPGKLFLGTLVDADEVWVNGVSVGTTWYQYPTRRYPIPAGVLVQGENTILIRLVCQRPGGGVTPGKPLWLEVGPLRIDLAGTWQARRGADAPVLKPDTFLPMVSLGLRFGVLDALGPLGLAGVLWYQGESNLDRASAYERHLRTLIASWRRVFQQPNLPFLLVQLPRLGAAAHQVVDDGWTGVREAQRQVSSTPFSGLVVTLDVGEWNDIHPANKQPVGERLALVARKIVYLEPLDAWTGPRVVSARGPGVVLTFDQCGLGLTTSDGNSPGAFFVSGPDGVFHRVEARISAPNEITLVSAISPKEVRYAWAPNPWGANLVNSVGLPASPFRILVNG